MIDTQIDPIERARGRWPEILSRLGIDSRFLINKHGPCPLCGGKDRFRFDDKEGNGSYYCNQCGPGSGLTLACKFSGLDREAICREIRDIIRDDWRPPAPTTHPRDNDGRGRRTSAILQILDEAKAPDVVDTYLRRRGLSVSSPVLQGHPACPFFDEKTKKMVGRFPAIIAPMVGPDGNIQSVLRIYDANVNPRKKALPPISSLIGATIRLFPAAKEMGIAEGVETALAAHQLFGGIAVWSCFNDGGIAAFQPPASVRRLVIFGDNDAGFAGQAAAYDLARRLARERREITVTVRIPSRVGADWLDVLCERELSSGRAATA